MKSIRACLAPLPIWLACLLCVILTGCGSMGHTSGNKVELIDRDGMDLIAAPAGHVSVIIKSANSKERTCGGRLPDAIMDSSIGLTLPTKGVGVGATNTDVALGGRSPQVLIVRELLYRLCELGLNADLPPKDIVELYKDTLPLISQALKSGVPGTNSTAIAGQNPGLAAPTNTPAQAPSAPANTTTSGTQATDSGSQSSANSASDPNQPGTNPPANAGGNANTGPSPGNGPTQNPIPSGNSGGATN